LLIGHATDLELDGNGRILLPQLLRTHAKLEKNALLVGQNNKFEIWDPLTWESERAQWLAKQASKEDGLPDEMKTLSL
jgi:MraZ protein